MMQYAFGLLPILAAFVYWTRGGHGALRPLRGLMKPAYGAILALPVLPLGLPLFALAAVAATGFVTIGHGNGLDMGRNPEKPDDPGEIMSLPGRALGLRPGSWADDAASMFLSGASYGLAPALILAAHGDLAALALIPALGLAKGAAYEAGWRLTPRKDPTWIGELLCGAGQGAVIAAWCV